MKLGKKYIFWFLGAFFIFTLILFCAKTVYDFYSYDEEAYIEEHFIEPVVLDAPTETLYTSVKQERKKQKELTKALQKDNEPLIEFHYLPGSYGSDQMTKIYTALLSAFYYSDPIFEKIEELHTYFYENRVDTRGRMKNKKVHMYDPTALPRYEFMAVSIHEFGHFLDLYILKKELYYDVSDRFYNISWLSSKKMKGGARSTDFVSGYSMTNKYEDFAESFAYYVLHNSDFLERAKNSADMMEKYNFFADYVFINGEFQTDIYKTTKEVRKYYWDTTKIEYSLTDFLRYLESGNLVANFSGGGVN